MKTLSAMIAVGMAVLGLCVQGPLAAESKELPKEMTIDLGGGVKMDFALIRSGSFQMGSESGSSAEKSVHKVTITKPFYMGKFEVTQEQWKAVMGTDPSIFKGAKNPVEQVSWDDCQEFLKKLSELKKGSGTFRLPTEAEWEYACRAGSKTRFSFGDAEADLHKYGNYCDSSNTNGLEWQDKAHSDGFDKTAPVGSFTPNGWGLYDMHGNVWEWVADWYGEYDKGAATDPTGPATGAFRVLRGGSWFGNATYCRSAFRSLNYDLAPVTRYGGLNGLRVVCVADKEVE